MSDAKLIEIMARAIIENSPLEDGPADWATTPEPHKHMFREVMKSVLSALRAAGFAIVPRDPNGDILVAGQRAIEDDMATEDVWRAMVSAVEGETK